MRRTLYLFATSSLALACSSGPPPCDASTCGDGCCTGDVCYVDATASDQHCGADASVCADCTLNGQLCLGGACCSPPGGGCCSAADCCQGSGTPQICHSNACGGLCGACITSLQPCFVDSDCCAGLHCVNTNAGLICE